jgi:predicted dehydrogenase
MSNYIENSKNPYEIITKINDLKFEKKSVLLIGAGGMARQYAIALKEMNISDVTIFSRTEENAIKLSTEFNFSYVSGDLLDLLKNMNQKDLVIIATSIESLVPITKLVIQNNQKNILVEKPGSVYFQDLLELHQINNNSRIRIAYNRLTYPNFYKLKNLILNEGGITSCNFNFTEQLGGIDFTRSSDEIYHRWGISNSLHVISMVFELIGFPKEFLFYQSGKLDWHPTGSVFVGSGLSEKNIPFSYHADWGSSGRWGIEIMTNENAYKLVSLEQLFVCPKNSFSWESVSFDIPFPDVKQGISEEIAVMLYPELEENIPLISLEKAAQFNQIAEKILGYDSK